MTRPHCLVPNAQNPKLLGTFTSVQYIKGEQFIVADVTDSIYNSGIELNGLIP